MGLEGGEVVCVTPMIRRRQAPGMHCASPESQDARESTTTCLDRCVKCLTTSLIGLLVVTSVVFLVSIHRSSPFQRLERRSLTGELSPACMDLQLMGNHLYG